MFVAQRKNKFFYTPGKQIPDNVLKKWLASNGRHTFRKIGNHGTKSCTQTPG